VPSCLSRAWAATLSSDAFVDRHFDLTNRHREAPRLCFLPCSAAAPTVYAWSPELGKGVFMPLMAVPHNSRNGKLHAVTRTCRGVLLLRATAARIYYLCNPSMRGQIAALPDGHMADYPRPSSDYAYPGHWRPAAGGALLPLERVRMNQMEMGVFVEGHVHWPTMGHEEQIVSFSMADERFGYVTSPPGTDVATLALADLAGCFCLLSAPDSQVIPEIH
jgi:hypothetical protein